MRHAEGGFDPASRNSTSWRLSVIGSPGVLGVVVMLGGTPANGSPRRTAAIRWQSGRAQSTRAGAAPIAGDRLKHRYGRERGGVGAQHPGPQPDARNKRQCPQGIKLVLDQPALRADQQRGISKSEPREDVGDRLAAAGLVADN